MRSEALYAELAAAILEGAPIDWAAAEASGSHADRPVLARLKSLAAIAELHRSQPASPVERPVIKAPAPSSRPPSCAIGQWGHLRLLERLGGGSFGEVYRAWDERLDREVALKLLDLPAGEPSTSSGSGAPTLLEEGRVLARVRHPNVVTLYDADVIDGRIGLWMELVSGKTLEQVVTEGKRFDAAEAAALGVDLCRAVGAVHAAGLLHRDIKAANVMLADDGRVVLMDFGAGRELDAAGGSVAGTPLYLAPELFAGGSPSAASDVYSLAVLLHRLLTGEYPVPATNVRDLRHAHQRGERAQLERERPDLPARFARAIDRALDPNPASRPTLDQLAADLAPAARSSRRSRLFRRLGVAAAVLLVLGTGWEILGRRSGKPTPSSAFFAGIGLLRPVASDARITEPTLVVLPFDNLGEGTEGDSFADGLADEIIRDLARVDGLAVRSRYSSFTFRDEPRDLGAIGRQLGANLAVTGSVLRSGDRIRVNAQLVDLGHDRPLWAGRFDRELHSAGDLFSIVDEIARSVVNELRLTLGAGMRRYDTDLETYDRFLEARALVERRGLDGPRDAIVILDQILDADPAFAPAHALLAQAYGYMSMLAYQSPVKPAEALERMRRAATRALELDPMLAEAHAAMGVVRAWERTWSKSEESFEHALDLDPTMTAISTGFTFWTLRPQFEYDRAQRVLESALESDPLSIDVQREIMDVAFNRGHYDDVIASAERLRALDPKLPFVNQVLGRALIFDQRPAEGLALLEMEDARGRTNGHYRAHGLLRLGRRAEVEQLAVEYRGLPTREAVIHTALGNLDLAFEALDLMMIGEPHRVPILLTYPEMAALREDPRMIALRERLGLGQRSMVEPPSQPP